jgi:hypothetical protein
MLKSLFVLSVISVASGAIAFAAPAAKIGTLKPAEKVGEKEKVRTGEALTGEKSVQESKALDKTKVQETQKALSPTVSNIEGARVNLNKPAAETVSQAASNAVATVQGKAGAAQLTAEEQGRVALAAQIRKDITRGLEKGDKDGRRDAMKVATALLSVQNSARTTVEAAVAEIAEEVKEGHVPAKTGIDAALAESEVAAKTGKGIFQGVAFAQGCHEMGADAPRGQVVPETTALLNIAIEAKDLILRGEDRLAAFKQSYVKVLPARAAEADVNVVKMTQQPCPFLAL